MTSIIPGISKIIDLCLKLADIRVQRRKDIFDKLLDPIFIQLIIIHKDYMKLFTVSLNTLPFYTEKYGWTDWDGNKFERFDGTFHKKIEEAKRIFELGREEYEAERVKIRGEAGAIINAKLRQAEKRFIFAVISYFISPEQRILSKNESIDMRILSIEEVGSVTALDTPSSSVATQIAVMFDPEKIRAVLSEAKLQQLERWTDVCRLYGELKSEVRTKL